MQSSPSYCGETSSLTPIASIGYCHSRPSSPETRVVLCFVITLTGRLNLSAYLPFLLPIGTVHINNSSVLYPYATLLIGPDSTLERE